MCLNLWIIGISAHLATLRQAQCGKRGGETGTAYFDELTLRQAQCTKEVERQALHTSASSHFGKLSGRGGRRYYRFISFTIARRLPEASNGISLT